VDTDLTALTNGVAAGPSSHGKQIAAVVTTPNNQRHVYFVTKNGNVQQLYFRMIAATALEHDLTMVTRNVKDFTGLGVTLINPWLE